MTSTAMRRLLGPKVKKAWSAAKALSIVTTKVITGASWYHLQGRRLRSALFLSRSLATISTDLLSP